MILLVPGHCKTGDRGAYSEYLKTTEQEYNKKVAEYLVEKYPDQYEIYEHTIQGYNSRQKELAKYANPRGYFTVVELHFNMFDSKAQGAETLYFKGSEKGKKYAEIITDIISNYWEIPNRGAKPVSGGNGYGFLKSMSATAVLVEPFFGDEEKAERFKDYEAYAEILHIGFKKIKEQ